MWEDPLSLTITLVTGTLGIPLHVKATVTHFRARVRLTFHFTKPEVVPALQSVLQAAAASQEEDQAQDKPYQPPHGDMLEPEEEVEPNEELAGSMVDALGDPGTYESLAAVVDEGKLQEALDHDDGAAGSDGAGQLRGEILKMWSGQEAAQEPQAGVGFQPPKRRSPSPAPASPPPEKGPLKAEEEAALLMERMWAAQALYHRGL